MASMEDLSLFRAQARRLAEARADWEINFKKCLSAYERAIS
jgi:hypothetical protein